MTAPPGPRVGGVVALFALALFSSAFLLFSLEPMVAKALLPKLGGTPTVWNTCMVFFQGTLLAGYLAAHVAARGRYVQRTGWLYPALLVAAPIALPLTFTRVPAVADQPSPRPGCFSNWCAWRVFLSLRCR